MGDIPEWHPEEKEAFQDEIQQKIGEQIEHDDRSPSPQRSFRSSTLRCSRKQLSPESIADPELFSVELAIEPTLGGSRETVLAVPL